MAHVTCRSCGETFDYEQRQGPSRLYCSTLCRRRYYADRAGRETTPDGRTRPTAMLRATECGHMVMQQTRAARRTLCDFCRAPLSVEEMCARDGCQKSVRSRLASRSSAPWPSGKRRRLYCSKWCSEVVRGTRIAEPIKTKVCALSTCSVEFQPKRDSQRCCCEKHGKLHWEEKEAAAGRDPKRDKGWTDARRDAYHRRRAAKKSTTVSGEVVARDAVAKRDGYRCGICSRKVDMARQWPHPLSPSLDHIVPLSAGGGHEMANVQLAHLRCNVSKGARGVDQMLLFG